MNKKEQKQFERMKQMLTQCRFWMGELHGYYWHRKIHKLDLGKGLVRDIKKVDRILQS